MCGACGCWLGDGCVVVYVLGAMRCPRCTLTIHSTAEECPHCGLTLEMLDELYAGFERRVGRLYDGAGVLRVYERRKVEDIVEKLERIFPQLTIAVSTVPLKDEQTVRSYGVWLMNRGDFWGIAEDVRLESGLVLLVLDAEHKQACLHFGYLLENGVTEKEAFVALSSAHPYLLESNFAVAIEVMLRGLKKLLKRARTQLKRSARRDG